MAFRGMHTQARWALNGGGLPTVAWAPAGDGWFSTACGRWQELAANECLVSSAFTLYRDAVSCLWDAGLRGCGAAEGRGA